MKKRRPIRPGVLPIRRIERRPDAGLMDDEWPATIPAIGQLLREGLDLSPVTVLVGENGSGKSTLVEAVAAAFGLSAEGGSPNAMHATRPESALSLSACIGLIGLLHDLVEAGTSQVILATHSPIVAALPGARILQFDDAGFHESDWAELELVQHYRRFLDEPMRYLRHVISSRT